MVLSGYLNENWWLNYLSYFNYMLVFLPVLISGVLPVLKPGCSSTGWQWPTPVSTRSSTTGWMPGGHWDRFSGHEQFFSKTTSKMYEAPMTFWHSDLLLIFLMRWCCKLSDVLTLSKLPLSVSYLIFSKRLLFKNIAQDGSFQHFTWLYPAVSCCTWLCLDLLWSTFTIDCHWLA